MKILNSATENTALDSSKDDIGEISQFDLEYSSTPILPTINKPSSRHR